MPELKVVTLALSDTYGPNDLRPKILNLLRQVAIKNQPFSMSPGGQLMNLVHVEDVARAYQIAAERFIESADAIHERYSVTAEKSIELRDSSR